MLDQKLIRENPTSVGETLSLRGKFYNISHIHELTVRKKDIDIEISNIQSESKKLSKLFGQEISKSQSDNLQIKTWGDPLIKENIKSHWEIGESLNIFDSVKSTKISKSRFITLIGNGARLELSLIHISEPTRR